MEVQNRGMDKLVNLDKLFILGFDSAMRVVDDSFNNIERSEMTNSIRCFKDATDDIKFFIKEHLLDDLNFMRENIIEEMINSYGEEKCKD